MTQPSQATRVAALRGYVSFLDQFEAGESISEVPSIIRAILPSFFIKWARPSPLKRAGEGMHGIIYTLRYILEYA